MDLCALCIHSPGTESCLCFIVNDLANEARVQISPVFPGGKSYCAAIFHADTAGKQTLKHWPVPCFIA